MSGKAPAFQFYPMDWERDLQEHPLEIEGAWIRICCKLWWCDPKGTATKTYEQWSRILGVSVEKTNEIFEYMRETLICDICVTDHGRVTVTSRRMFREDRDRRGAAERKRRQRERQSCHADVTSPSSTSSSSSSSKKEINTTSKSSPTIPPCPHQAIVSLFHKMLPELPKVTDWTTERQALLRARWNEKPERRNSAWWIEYFNTVRKSSFLMGQTDPAPGRKLFRADLEWLVRKSNMIKVLEKKYEDGGVMTREERYSM